MKKINSIGYRHWIVLVSILFLVPIPLLFHEVWRKTGSLQMLDVVKISLVMGTGTAFFLTVLLVVELGQDRRINRKYAQSKNTLVKLRNGMYECQACGHRFGRGGALCCPVCAISYNKRGERTMDKQASDANIPQVAQTLYIPLSVRAAEAQQKEPLFMDDKAVEIIRQVDLVGVVYDGGPVASHGILARTKVLDEQVAKKLSRCPNTLVINLGAGLDTRICRLDNGTALWVDVDLPKVIGLRAQHFVGQARMQLIAGTVLDSAWLDQVDDAPYDTVVIIAEGLLMYLEQAQVAQLLCTLAQRFPGADMFFDVVHPYFVSKGISSPFLWGLSNARQVKKLNAKVRLVQSWSTGSILKQRQPAILRVLNLLPATRNRSQILHIRFLD